MKDSKEYYTQLAVDYSEISTKRAKYLDKIDQLVGQFAPENTKRYLDIGAGDGRRSFIVARMVKAKEVVMLDNCQEITNPINYGDNFELVVSELKDFHPEKNFDLITSLWNVLGHVGETEDKVGFLQKVKELLTDDGVFITDVNNRYNAVNYGWKGAMRNMYHDMIGKKDSGWFPLGSQENQTMVYIHNPFEIEKLATQVGLKLKTKKFVDYQSGEINNAWWKGQTFYVFQKA